MESILSQIFTSDYNRTSFEDNVLKPVFLNSVKDFVLYDEDGEQEVELTDTEKRTAKKIVKYGEFKTHDNRKIELYEVTVEDFRQVKIARVGLGALVKKLIIGNNAVFATFKYEDVTNKHWRFSFIAYDSFFEEGQVQTKETNPKRYTYVFGDEDETYRTAIDRFAALDSKFQIKVKDIQDAFAVEAMSKEFFDEYRETHYAKFVKFLTGEEFQKKGGKFQLVEVQNPSPFLASVFNGDKKEARDFCKKLLGQIVFLYFIQKKGWLGATDTNYKEGNGDKNFIQNFYKQAGENDTFYPLWLSKLFYDTLNQKRTDDDFTMPDGKVVKIPYLNGGLFEKESEKFDHLVFPSELFTDLFEFFNRFNFTIYENSPEEHTIAVDPEMLGHIFENLLEDNKDKGAFYTPKEIVQYMTQESLIEYLVTHLGENAKNGISQFVKQKDKEALTDTQLKEINNLLDKVKICDPAIGSGAFPMGLLHEIFALKERIAFDLGFKVWSPATVKENIIQNSIYGVDIEKGAVDIAQLRFWLSLIVDEEEPKPLPNLAYKIVVGNSLVSKFGDEIIEIDWEVDEGTQSNLFGNPYQEDIQDLLKKISEKQKEYFTANNTNKPRLTKEIRLLKLEILSKQLELMINTKGFEKVGNKRLSKPQTERWLETEGWKRTLQQVNTLKTNNKPFNHFDWRLDFPEILNPIINKNKDKRGFDIIIANPPYVGVKGNTETFKTIKKGRFSKFFKGRAELFYFFMHLSIDLSKNKGVSTFITTNYFITSTDGNLLRKDLKENTTPLRFLNFNELKLFSTALGQHNMITLFQKGKLKNKSVETFYTSQKGRATQYILNNLFSKKDSETEYYSLNQDEVFEGDEHYIRTRGTSGGNSLLHKIFSVLGKGTELGSICDVRQGLRTGADKISNSHINKFGFSGVKGEGVFILSLAEIKRLGYDEPNDIIKPLFKNSDIIKFYSKEYTDQFLLYIDNEIELLTLKNEYPTIYEHILQYKDLICNIRGKNNEKSGNWFRLDRPREKYLFEGEKICVPQRSNSNRFGFHKGAWYASADVYFIKSNDAKYKLKYLLALLNSNLFYLWFYFKGKRKGEMLELYQKPLSEAPILLSNRQDLYVKFVDYILFIKSEKPNDLNFKLIDAYFEQIINGLIYELYFPELLKENKRTIIEHLGDLPEFTKSTTNFEKEEIINKVFKRLDDKDHPVRNNLFYMRNIEEIATIEELKE